MSPQPSAYLDDLAAALPQDPAAYADRLALARRALLQLRPHLTAGDPAAVQARDLRAIFLALDLFVLGGRYLAVFDDLGHVAFTWTVASAVASAADAQDARLEHHAVVVGEGLDAAEEVLLKFHIAPHRLSLVSTEAPHDALVAGLMEAMLRLMMLGAAIVAEEERGAGVASAAWLLRRLAGETEAGGG